jgi:hypothetical protein
MLTPEIAGEKLRELKIFTPPEVVMMIVQHLKADGKQNVLYKANPPLASNHTILKIKKLLDAGKLDWVTDELASLNLLLDGMEKASDEDLARNIMEMARRGWEIYKDDDLGEFRLRITKEAEESIKDFGWSVTNLVGIGIPLEDTHGMLQEYDGLVMTCESSVHGVSKGYDEYTWYLRKFRGFEQYLYLNHLVYLMQKYPNNPPEHYAAAAALYTRGVVSSDDSIKTAGEDILRYEISRGGEYLKAYKESLKQYKRTPKRNRELSDQIDHLMKTTIPLSGTTTPVISKAVDLDSLMVDEFRRDDLGR